MADEITPALTLDQWGAHARGETIEVERWAGGRAAIHPAQYQSVRYPLVDMALANAALPDGHPNKLAWSDVEVVTRILPQWVAAARGESVTIDLATSPQDVLERLAALAAKLSALLPPEDAR
jgi:hypothetical protein